MTELISRPRTTADVKWWAYWDHGYGTTRVCAQIGEDRPVSVCTDSAFVCFTLEDITPDDFLREMAEIQVELEAALGVTEGASFLGAVQ